MKTNKEKQFDCIKMKDQIQAAVYSETKNMTKEELLRYFNGNTKDANKITTLHSTPVVHSH
ncbi:MAG: hypothetical protein FWG77_11520 [Treponema sp.]|nr:hypothetical protein [Treponema sp.]